MRTSLPVKERHSDRDQLAKCSANRVCADKHRNSHFHRQKRSSPLHPPRLIFTSLSSKATDFAKYRFSSQASKLLSSSKTFDLQHSIAVEKLARQPFDFYRITKAVCLSPTSRLQEFTDLYVSCLSAADSLCQRPSELVALKGSDSGAPRQTVRGNVDKNFLLRNN